MAPKEAVVVLLFFFLKKSSNRITELFHLQRPQSFHSLNKPIKVDIFQEKKSEPTGWAAQNVKRLKSPPTDAI